MSTHYEHLDAAYVTVTTVTEGHTPDGEPAEECIPPGMISDGAIASPLALVLSASEAAVIEGTADQLQTVIDRMQTALNAHRAPRDIVDDAVNKLAAALDAHVPETTVHYAVEELRSALSQFARVSAGPEHLRPIKDASEATR